jgi:hypothetical protein
MYPSISWGKHKMQANDQKLGGSSIKSSKGKQLRYIAPCTAYAKRCQPTKNGLETQRFESATKQSTYGTGRIP